MFQPLDLFLLSFKIGFVLVQVGIVLLLLCCPSHSPVRIVIYLFHTFLVKLNKIVMSFRGRMGIVLVIHLGICIKQFLGVCDHLVDPSLFCIDLFFDSVEYCPLVSQVV